jgi:hypothetical protein
MTKEELHALCTRPDWRWCTSEGAELHTLLLGLQTTFREKVEWLEEAETLTLRLRASREKARVKSFASRGGKTR